MSPPLEIPFLTVSGAFTGRNARANLSLSQNSAMFSIKQILRKWSGRKPVAATPEPSAYTIPENRPLTRQERTLTEWLIANGVPEARSFRAQLDHLRVVGRCSCGCPTVDLAVESSQGSTAGASLILADYIGVTPEGIEVGVILHAREGKLSELEVYSLGKTDTTNRTFDLPAIESLKPFIPPEVDG